MKLAIKVTKPITPILFLAEADVQLQQLKETLHLIEVNNSKICTKVKKNFISVIPKLKFPILPYSQNIKSF